MQRLIQASRWAGVGALILGGLALMFDFFETTVLPDNGTLNAAFSAIAAAFGAIAGGIYGAIVPKPRR